ncbi:glutamine synthetase [Aplysia californica]|uniref:Lengsin n=1 Tax=Aplysia californica TaxID=6500 RepID=A0ABM1ACH3_APLCA|nr:glutamine synthetase [Aplysia californica]
MSKVDKTAHFGIGMHFNHSLWTLDAASVLLDNSREDQLSDVARHWIAGLVKHGPGLTALCSPTVNCYRRMGQKRLPTRSDWSVQDKNATFVVRKSRGDNIFIEDRLPSSASNPYLVMAATVAAGIDGIRNKIPLPSQTEEFCLLPPDLETALTCLKEDAVLVGALGKDLVELFVATKTMEIDHLKSMGQTSGTDSFQHEYHLYFQNA